MFLAAALPFLLAASSQAPKAVPWTEVRAAIERTICAQVRTLPSGKEAVAFLQGARDLCAGAPATTSVETAVDEAIEGARTVLTSIGNADVAFDPGQRPMSEWTAPLRDAYLGSPLFLRPILRRLPAALGTRGLACPDCPAADKVEPRRTNWDDLRPYVVAYFWPDPVVTSKADGKPAGESRISMHICVGINGIAEMKDPDRLLARAGFVAAFQNAEMRDLALSHLMAIRGEDAFTRAPDDGARTTHLRKRLSDELSRDPALRKSACATLERASDDLGLVIAGCD